MILTPILVQLAYRAGEINIGVCVVTANSAVNDVLATAGVEELFEIYPYYQGSSVLLELPPRPRP